MLSIIPTVYIRKYFPSQEMSKYRHVLLIDEQALDRAVSTKTYSGTTGIFPCSTILDMQNVIYF